MGRGMAGHGMHQIEGIADDSYLETAGDMESSLTGESRNGEKWMSGGSEQRKQRLTNRDIANIGIFSQEQFDA